MGGWKAGGCLCDDEGIAGSVTSTEGTVVVVEINGVMEGSTVNSGLASRAALGVASLG